MRAGIEKVLAVFADGGWHTLEAVCEATGIRYPSTVASRLRDAAHNEAGPSTRSLRYAYERRAVPGTKFFEYRVYEVRTQQLSLLDHQAA